ncbi:HTH-type transcriptional repressor SmtB [Planctopirus ephydatiae]|uniref:HTH-type transcriptional repressor SmtB n=2 Tax=Planctopirus ephydatiae TaxID=2528019 RepID=A0A518GQR8_9PLAN|nr:HTH-type transcriptional repressor SmtB [Planctopirus ephydatiae]
MPSSTVATREMAELLGVLSHPCRVQIVEELRDSERNVNALQELLGISHSGVSQHLALLRTRKLLKERRSGRHVYYRLANPRLAEWLKMGNVFLDQPSPDPMENSGTVNHASANASSSMSWEAQILQQKVIAQPEPSRSNGILGDRLPAETPDGEDHNLNSTEFSETLVVEKPMDLSNSSTTFPT